jgi:hypothetical protein
MALEAFAADWQNQHCGEIDELVEVFGMVPDDCEHTRWDRLRGLLQLGLARGAAHPPPARTCRNWRSHPRLGRARPSDEPDAASRELVEVMDRPSPARRAAACACPTCRARRAASTAPTALPACCRPKPCCSATRACAWSGMRDAPNARLLCYEDDDRMRSAAARGAGAATAPRSAARRRLEMGPMLVCVDTSGSMQGGAARWPRPWCWKHARRPCAGPRLPRVRLRRPRRSGRDGSAVDRAGIERLIRFSARASAAAPTSAVRWKRPSPSKARPGKWPTC